MSKTKIVGYLMVALAVLKLAVDLLDGGEFRIQEHWEAVTTALAGAGLVFLRSGVDKAAAAK